MKKTSGKITPAINAAAFRTLCIFLPFAAALLFASCNQDDIFYQIEYETKLKDPLIEGGPSKIARLGDDLYVASGEMWHYPAGQGWRKFSNPPGIKVLDIAATDGYLYAITSRKGVNLGDSGYYRLKKGDSEWEERIPSPPGYPYPNAIYGTEDTLFAAAARESYYAVYALRDGEQEFKLIRGPSAQGEGMLVGAIKYKGYYFISLDGLGVFRLDSVDNPVLTPVTGSTGKGNFAGLIEIDDTLLMVSTSGFICKLSSAGESVTGANSRSLDFGFTGALAVWHDPSDLNNRLLLLGRKGSNTNYSGYGYYECQIPGGFDVKTLGIIEPLYTVEKNASYKNSLGKRAINSIIQAPDGIIFASTQSYNLWACRGGVWNYE